MCVIVITTHWIPILLTLGLFTFSKVFTLTSPRNMEEENVPLMFAEAVQGTEGRLPCNVTPPMSDDRVILVIWYKEGYTTPVYSFDIRESKFEKGRHWFDEESLGGRAFFEAGALPATLNIKSIKSTDTGVYRCRVDFVKSPTRNSRVQLTVIIPPEELRILDEKGTYIPHYILGPYNEGSSINVTCVSLGGRPLPNVTWWHENTLLDASSTVLSDNRVKNVLNLDKLKRSNLNMVLTCQASNNNITTPITSSVTLDMNLRPLWVKLQGENRPLSADSSYELFCEVVGSRPSPSITWWKGSIQMRNTREITSTDGNTTQSILSYTPTIDDRGKFLSCRAEQTLISDSGIESGWKLDIYHIPVVTLEFGTNYNTSSIREGADVYFECNIKSNPWIYKVSWRHNGKNLDNSIPDGIIVANQSLVLQNVSRARSGLYTCIGSNREGDGESNAVQLDIKFAPICKPGQINLYNAGRHEIVRVSCDLDANPTDVQFTWKFNATNLESIDIAASLIQTDKSRSIVAYTPMTEHDYGSLLCWGANEIGIQSEPCIFSIIPAGRPDSLTNCSVLNQTSTTFQIECQEGFDGGLEQNFVVELYPTGTRQLIASIKSKIPYFELKSLDPGMGYDIILAAMNKKGRSDLTILQAYTLKNPEKQTDLTLAYSPAIEHMKPFLGTLLGIVGALLLIAVIIVIVVQMRGSNGRDRNNCPSHTRQETIPRNGQLFNEIGQESCNDSVDSIEKNPDVVPQENKNEDRDEDETAFEWTHPRMYATQVVADQQNGMKTGYGVSEKQNLVVQQQQLQQQQPTTQFPVQIPTHPSYYTAVIPATSLGYNKIPPPVSRDLTYADLSVAHQAKPFFSSATLGRPRQSELKRTEPTIYAQIDLAHHLPHPMYSTSTMYGTNTGVTMSHPSQMTTFPPPPLFASQNMSTMSMPPNSMNTSVIPMCGNGTNQPTLLQMVPEGKILSQPIQLNIETTSIPAATTTSSGILIKGNGTTIGDKNISSTTRF